CLERATERDQRACLCEVDTRVIGHHRGLRRIKAEGDELVEPPDARPLRLFRLVELGRRSDLFGLVHLDSRIDPRGQPAKGHPAHREGRIDPGPMMRLREPRKSAARSQGPYPCQSASLESDRLRSENQVRRSRARGSRGSHRPQTARPPERSRKPFTVTINPYFSNGGSSPGVGQSSLDGVQKKRRQATSSGVLSANCAFLESPSVLSNVRSHESRQGASRKLPRRGYLGDPAECSHESGHPAGSPSDRGQSGERVEGRSYSRRRSDLTRHCKVFVRKPLKTLHAPSPRA